MIDKTRLINVLQSRYVLATLLVLLVCLNGLFGQMDESVRTRVNRQIRFYNEAIHGMLVAHRLIEGFNNDINKYVDLPSFSINNIQNGDLPGDIFQDPQRLFYETPPGALYSIITTDRQIELNPNNTLQIIETVRQHLRSINEVRLSLENTLEHEDIDQFASLQAVYGAFEQSIEYYERVRRQIRRFEELMKPAYYSPVLDEDRLQVYTAILDIHEDIKKTLSQIRLENQSSVIQSLTKIQTQLTWLSTCVNDLTDNSERAKFSSMLALFRDVELDIQSYIDGKELSPEYAVFGKGYFYHNVKILTKMNRYGNGYVSMVNQLFDDLNWNVLHLIEEPHFVKVAYPDRISVEEINDSPPDASLSEIPQVTVLTSSTTKEVEKISPPPDPSLIKTSRTIQADSAVFEIELFDHRVKDGDLVSIYVNGAWMFENVSLETDPQSIELEVSTGQPNRILIQAVNEGWRPPNTIGVRYISNGAAKSVFFITDLKSGEVLEIIYSN